MNDLRPKGGGAAIAALSPGITARILRILGFNGALTGAWIIRRPGQAHDGPFAAPTIPGIIEGAGRFTGLVIFLPPRPPRSPNREEPSRNCKECLQNRIPAPGGGSRAAGKSPGLIPNPYLFSTILVQGESPARFPHDLAWSLRPPLRIPNWRRHEQYIPTTGNRRAAHAC